LLAENLAPKRRVDEKPGAFTNYADKRIEYNETQWRYANIATKRMAVQRNFVKKRQSCYKTN